MSHRRLPLLDRALGAFGLARTSTVELRAAGTLNDPVIRAMFEAGGDPAARTGLPAVEAAVSLIAGTVASLPARVMQPRDDGTYEPAPRHPASKVLAWPNPELTAFELVERIVADAALSGAGYAEIVRDGRGAPAELRYLPPGHVGVERSPATRRPLFRIVDPVTNEHRILSDEDCLAVRYRLDPSDPLRGMALPRIGSGTLDLAVATERHARNLFAKGARPGGILKTAKKLSPETRSRLRTQIESFFGGWNSGSVAVFEEDMNWIEVSVSNRDSQHVETSELLVSQIARLFSIPPPLLGQLANTNYSSLQALVSVWTRTGLRSWLARIEGALSDKLLSEDGKSQGQLIRFDVEPLLRLDERERADVAAKLVGSGIATANEVRRRENWTPLPGGDDLMTVPGAGVANDNTGRPRGSRDLQSGNPTTGPNRE